MTARLGRAAAAWLLAALALFETACLPGYTVTEGGEPVTVTGQLRGELLNRSLPCVWLEDRAGDRTYLILPPDVTAAFNPTRLVDAAGSVVATEGEIVTVTGPQGGVGDTSCSPGSVPFEVSTIDAGTGASPPRP